MELVDRLRHWIAEWRASREQARADRVLLSYAPQVPADVARRHWALERASVEARNAFQSRYNDYVMRMGTAPPDPFTANLERALGGNTARALTYQAMLQAGITQPDRRSFTWPTWAGVGGRHPGMRQLPKPTPWNLRRFSEAPPPRRAINKIKNAVLRLEWDVVPYDEHVANRGLAGIPARQLSGYPTDLAGRIAAIKRALRYPNEQDTWRTVLEQVLEDILVGAFGSLETRLWEGNALQPFRLWPVDGMSIRINADWEGDDSEDEDRAYRYSQTLAYGGAGVHAPVTLRRFKDRELLYLRFDSRTNTPFGLSPTEVAFNMINAFLGHFEARERMESNDIPPFAIDLGEDATLEDVQRYRAYWENEIEGNGKIPIAGGYKQPQILQFRQRTVGSALNAWPEVLLRMIAISYGLAPQTFGVERDVNRNTSEVMQSEEFADAVLPIVASLEDQLTHHLIWKLCGWDDLKIKFDVTAGDPEKQASVAVQLFSGNVSTLNEAREAAGLDPLPPEDQRGDMFMMEIAQPPAPPPGAPPGMPGAEDPMARLMQEMGMGGGQGGPSPQELQDVTEQAALADAWAASAVKTQAERMLEAAAQLQQELAAAAAGARVTVTVKDPAAFQALRDQLHA